MIHYIENFRKLSYPSEEKYGKIHYVVYAIIRHWNTVYSYAIQYIGEWKTPQIFPFPNMWVGIKILIISSVLYKRLDPNPSLSSVLWSVSLDSDLMLWMLILLIVCTKNEETPVILWLLSMHNCICMCAIILTWKGKGSKGKSVLFMMLSVSANSE